SRCMTPEDVALMVRDSHEIKVIVHANGKDVYQITLARKVMEEENSGPGRLVDASREMLHDRGQALLDYVRKTLNVPADIRHDVDRRREGLETMADDALERALRRLRIPTRGDIDRINERLDRLAAASRQANGAATTRPRKRKA